MFLVWFDGRKISWNVNNSTKGIFHSPNCKMDNPGATPLFPHEEGKDSIAEEEDASPVVEWKDDQRWPLPHEPQCLICQRYGMHPPLNTTVIFPLFIYFVFCVRGLYL